MLLPAVMGWQRAAEVLFTEPWISAEQAVADGLAWRSVAPDALLDEAMTVARHIGGLPLGPVVATKQLLLDGRSDAVRAARLRELEAFNHLVGALMAPDPQ